MKPSLFIIALFLYSTTQAEVLTDKNGIVINKGDYLNLKFTDLTALNERIGNSRTQIMESPTCNQKSLAVSIDGQQVGSDGGFSSQQKLSQSFDNLYLTYTVKIGADFDFNSYLDDGNYSTPCNTNKQNCTLSTGKLFGLSGGDIETNSGGIDDPKNRNRGWSVRVNWREGGEAHLYVYHMNQGDKNSDTGEYGEDFKFNLKSVILKPGQTYTVTLHILMNTIGQRNGLLEAYFDGVPVAHYTDLEYRSDQPKSGNIQNLMLSAFIGGSGRRYQHKHDEQLSFSNVALHTIYNPKHPDIFKSTCLFELAGTHCNNYFAQVQNSQNLEFEDFIYRAYQNNFVGIKQDDVFVVGRDFPQILQVGKLDGVIELLSSNGISTCQ